MRQSVDSIIIEVFGTPLNCICHISVTDVLPSVLRSGVVPELCGP